MSYAQKPTFAEEVQGRLGDAIGRWIKGLGTLCRAPFKPRSITILDIPAGNDRLQSTRLSVIQKTDALPGADGAGKSLLPPLS